jgi:UDP-N-acetylenolpyruvoylglucosamine reductase
MISLREIQSFFKGTIKLSEPLAKYTAIGIGGDADYFFEPSSSKELAQLLDYFQEREFPYVIVHPNMLVSERGFHGAAMFLGHDDGERPRKRRGVPLFRNPDPDSVGASASEIVKELGLQGLKLGGVYVALDDANVVVNDGRATTDDVLSLIRHIQAEAWRRKGIALESDVQLVGFEQHAFAEVV